MADFGVGFQGVRKIPDSVGWGVSLGICGQCCQMRLPEGVGFDGVVHTIPDLQPIQLSHRPRRIPHFHHACDFVFIVHVQKIDIVGRRLFVGWQYNYMVLR